ncbi:hypothetical protein N9L92_05150, partial [Saprospiraceae bacterium]|nr:hypothetical protein [Saprospiraceae bacterium]
TFTDEETQKLNVFIINLNEAIDKEDKDIINLAMKNLNDYSAPLAERAMNHNIKKALSGKTI